MKTPRPRHSARALILALLLAWPGSCALMQLGCSPVPAVAPEPGGLPLGAEAEAPAPARRASGRDSAQAEPTKVIVQNLGTQAADVGIYCDGEPMTTVQAVQPGEQRPLQLPRFCGFIDFHFRLQGSAAVYGSEPGRLKPGQTVLFRILGTPPSPHRLMRA